jgi:hypothetical protein
MSATTSDTADVLDHGRPSRPARHVYRPGAAGRHPGITDDERRTVVELAGHSDRDDAERDGKRACNGAGVIYTDLAMMAGVATICEECEGKRSQASVLDHHLHGRDSAGRFRPASSATGARPAPSAGPEPSDHQGSHALLP